MIPKLIFFHQKAPSPPKYSFRLETLI
jgi:hypothetical protein